MLVEKLVHTDTYAGRVDLLMGIDDFETSAQYDDDLHMYTLNGEFLPSVTQVLNDGSFDHVDKEILEYARKRGNFIHNEIEEYLKNGVEGISLEFAEFKKIFEVNKEKFLEGAVIDYKSSSSVMHSKWKKQLEMYRDAVKYLTGVELKGLYVIWLPRDKPGQLLNMSDNGRLIEVSNKIVELETQLAMLSDVEKSIKREKANLKVLMEENNVKKFVTPNGTQITLIKDGEDKMVDVEKFDKEQFKKDHATLVQNYEEIKLQYTTVTPTLKKGRKGYVKITPPKGE